MLLGFSSSPKVWVYLSGRGIPTGDISQISVVDFLASSLKPEGFKGRLNGKLSPQSIRSELYGLVSTLKFQFGLEIDPTVKGSLIKRFITGALKLASARVDVFPKWDLRNLLTLLCSNRFEPSEERSFRRCKYKAIILMMLTTGRRFEDVQALTKVWHQCRSQTGDIYLKFTFFEGWKGKAENLYGWRPKDITLFSIAQGQDDPDLSALCPVKAFRKFWERRKDLGDPNYLWIQ